MRTITDRFGLGLMEIFRFSAHLRLRHPNADPDVISKRMGRPVRRQWRTGELMRGPEGASLGRAYSDTYWSSEPRKGEDSELIAVMESDLQDLEKREPFLREFRDSGGRVVYYVSWFSGDRSGGETISFEILRRMADLRISLALDVYSAAAPDAVSGDVQRSAQMQPADGGTV
jgi:hypothetical protein